MKTCVERDSKGKLVRPHFTSLVPRHLISRCSPAEQWQCEQQSIMSQQNEWLIAQALDTDERQNIVEKKLEAFEILRIMVSSKWSVVGWIVTAILIPLGLVGATVWVKNHFGKID